MSAMLSTFSTSSETYYYYYYYFFLPFLVWANMEGSEAKLEMILECFIFCHGVLFSHFCYSDQEKWDLTMVKLIFPG